MPSTPSEPSSQINPVIAGVSLSDALQAAKTCRIYYHGRPLDGPKRAAIEGVLGVLREFQLPPNVPHTGRRVGPEMALWRERREEMDRLRKALAPPPGRTYEPVPETRSADMKGAIYKAQKAMVGVEHERFRLQRVAGRGTSVAADAAPLLETIARHRRSIMKLHRRWNNPTDLTREEIAFERRRYRQLLTWMNRERIALESLR